MVTNKILRGKLFPACAGVIPSPVLPIAGRQPFPRVCGGDPRVHSVRGHLATLFPACAGVILTMDSIGHGTPTFPRVCGGDPMDNGKIDLTTLFSPRVRG